jgi:hypothetical protein
LPLQTPVLVLDRRSAGDHAHGCTAGHARRPFGAAIAASQSSKNRCPLCDALESLSRGGR